MAERRWLDRLWQWGYRLAYVGAMGYWLLRRARTRGVCVAVWWRHQVLLIDNSYRRMRGLPGGGIHSGEPLAEAAARALVEEAGVAVAPAALNHLGDYEAYVDCKVDRLTVHEFLAEERPGVRIDNREVVWADFLTVAECRRLPISPILSAYLRGALAPASWSAAAGPVTRTTPSRPFQG